MTVRYLLGDTRDVCATIPDDSVDLIFTSPPFLALRSYLPSDHEHKHKEIGSEANPAAFLNVLLELTAEWRRVLAPHGTLAVELGDTYSGSGGAGGDYAPGGWLKHAPKFDGSANRERRLHPDVDGRHRNSDPNRPELRYNRSDVGGSGWPLAKSLACIPDLYKVALAYGVNPLTGQPSPAGRWRVRNDLTWLRPNPPVGALGDKWRPASSRIIVACTGARRWFDLDAVRTEVQHPDAKAYHANEKPQSARRGMGDYDASLPAGAPPLDWHADGDIGVGSIILATAPYKGSHYATFPPELPRKIIDCMCPRQVCRVCGKPRERLTDSHVTLDGEITQAPYFGRRGESESGSTSAVGVDHRRFAIHRENLGWSDCECPEYPPGTAHLKPEAFSKWRPGHVLDPFAGTGTTLMAAQDLGRDATGIDIDERNLHLARERVGMFLEVGHYTSPVVDVVSDLL